VPALEPVEGWRVVATPAALDAARWHGDDVDVIRIAPDEALGIGATDVDLDDPDAIVEPEAGFSVALLTRYDLLGVRDHVDWELPDDAGVIGQGKVAGVPVKVVAGDPTVLVVQTAYTDELRSRLGW
jgi:hypothetical protein